MRTSIFLLCLTLCGHAFAAEQPNVIFILCDDLGWGDLGVLHQNSRPADKRHATPNLDAMAAEGIQLRRHYCPAPVCAPSRSSLLTGTHQGHAEVRDNQFDKALENNHTLATVMKSAGYSTALIGKYGLQGDGETPDQWPAYPTKRGFDEFFGYVRHVDGHVHYPAHEWPLGDSEKHRAPKELWWNDREVSSELTKCYTADLFTARSKNWIADHMASSGDEPFFLYLAYDTPHAALQVPSVAYPDGGGLKGGLQWTGKPGEMINTAAGEIDSYRHPDYVGRGWTDVEERFATMVRRIDDCVGDLLQTLRDLEIDDNTIVVISSDNGPHEESYLAGKNYDPTSFASYGPMDGIKRDVYEGGIRVPTLAWWPKTIPAGTIDQTPSQFHDWMATFADLAGRPAPARCDGVSLKPLLTGKQQLPLPTVYVEYFNNGKFPNYGPFAEDRKKQKRGQQQVVFVDGLKGVRTNVKSQDDPFQIYDVIADPAERNNLAGTDAKFDALQAKMHDRVLQIRRPNESAPRPYDDESVPAVKKTATQPGLIVSHYPGDFDYVPNCKSLHRSERGWSNDLTARASASGAIEWSGYAKVEADGEYTFTLNSDAPALVRLHDAILIDDDFGHVDGQTVTTKIRLAAGLHPIRITTLVTDGKPPKISLSAEGVTYAASRIP